MQLSDKIKNFFNNDNKNSENKKITKLKLALSVVAGVTLLGMTEGPVATAMCAGIGTMMGGLIMMCEFDGDKKNSMEIKKKKYNIKFTEKDNTITKCNSNSGLDNQSGNTNKVCQENVVLKNDAKLVAYAMKKTGHTK